MVLGLVGGAAMQRRGPKSDTRGAGAVQRLRRAPCRGGGGRDARTKAGRRRAAATRLMSERRRGSLYVLATRRPWAEVSHNFVQRRRRPARPALPKKGSRRAPARPPHTLQPQHLATRAAGASVPSDMKQKVCVSASRPNHDGAPRTAVARHTHKARRRRHTRLISSRRRDGVWTALTSRHRSDGRGDGVIVPLDAVDAAPSARRHLAPPPHAVDERRSTRPSTCKIPRPGPTRMI